MMSSMSDENNNGILQEFLPQFSKNCGRKTRSLQLICEFKKDLSIWLCPLFPDMARIAKTYRQTYGIFSGLSR